MKLLLPWFLVVSLCFGFKAKAQMTYEPILFANFNFVNHFGMQAGLETLLSSGDRENKLFLGAGYGMLFEGDAIRGLADLHLSYNCGLVFAKIGGSELHFYSQAGISLLHFLDMGVGYSMPYRKEGLQVKGFTFGLTFRLSGNDDVYPKLKFGF